jgi:cyclopropane-fatty-acyl-phospholipid synthase
VRLQDYRDLGDEQFDAISSIGMFEHVGEARLRAYATILFGLLRPEGRLLNHGISRPAGPAPLEQRSFINRYVFPDGELHEVGRVASVLQESGFEVRDVESLREHYARTLRCWVTNLEAHWDEAVALVGAPRARVWRLYMAGSARNFEAGRTMIHQVLGVRQGPHGQSGMPATRRSWYQRDQSSSVPERRPAYSGGSGGRGDGAGGGDGDGDGGEGTAPAKR